MQRSNALLNKDDRDDVWVLTRPSRIPRTSSTYAPSGAQASRVTGRKHRDRRPDLWARLPWALVGNHLYGA
jgi:hypothetical protein